jgi:hypothetical protein
MSRTCLSCSKGSSVHNVAIISKTYNFKPKSLHRTVSSRHGQAGKCQKLSNAMGNRQLFKATIKICKSKNVLRTANIKAYGCYKKSNLLYG